MKTKLALAAFVLAVLPMVAHAGCRGEVHKPMSTSACETGQTWDEATQACVPSVAS